MLSSIALCGLVAIAHGADGPEDRWDRLLTTWKPNFWNGFYPVPIKEPVAGTKDANEWKKYMSCSDSGSPGNVYIGTDNDISSMPIYNADGWVSGIILGMLNPGQSITSFPSNYSFVELKGPDGTFWAVVGLFRDPDTICTQGTTSEQKGSALVGDRLLFWNGEGPGKHTEVPPRDDGLYPAQLSATDWKLGGCMVGMGFHYWRHLNADINCNEQYPIFLLYVKHKLVGWGIAMAHDDRPYIDTKRWEHPPGDKLGLFFAKGDYPKCLANQGILTTQHIFMTDFKANLCPILGIQF